jgi:hypothetical protein
MFKIVLKPSLFLLFSLLMICCKDRPPIQEETSEKEVIAKPNKISKINKVNFYFENSLSMKGYLKGDKFRGSMAEIIYNFNKDSVNTYFVNTKAYKTLEILDKIRNNKIDTGDTGNSDHKFIFTNAIKNAANNNLSIVVTDGIYSMGSSKVKLTLGDVEKDIEKAFENALKQNELETVVLKMTSNFKGSYYSESCKKKGGTQIDQERPYYILLFGNKDVIAKALQEIVVIKDLEGYKEQARFLITKDLKVNYSLLTKGEEKQGDYTVKISNQLYNVKEIEDAEKFSKSGLLLKDRYLQFGVAVDYSTLSIPSNYLINPLNYSIENNTGYRVGEIKTIKDLSKSSQTYKWIQNLNKKGNMNFTHIVVVKAKSKLYGDLKVNLDINFPSWIKETGSENDCEIKNDSKTTFAFDRLMNGISKAYEKVTGKNKFFELKINIKP